MYIKSQLKFLIIKLIFCTFSLYTTLWLLLQSLYPRASYSFLFSVFHGRVPRWKHNGVCSINQINQAIDLMASLRQVKTSDELVWVFLPCFYYCYYFSHKPPNLKKWNELNRKAMIYSSIIYFPPASLLYKFKSSLQLQNY